MNKWNTITAIQQLYGSNWELAVYAHYCGQAIPADKNILSPLRDNDSAPSLRVFKTDDGSYLSYDYGRDETHNVWSFACAYHDNKNKTSIGSSMERGIKLVNADLNLGLDSDDPFHIAIPQSNFAMCGVDFKKSAPPEIAVYPKNWGGIDHNYWSPYFITEDDLAFFDCGVSQKTLFSYDKGFVWKDYHYYKQRDPMYYYHFTDSKGRSRFKILRPFADSQFKWRTNIDKSDMNSIQGFAQADLTQDKVVLTSSLKDVIILRKMGITAYALHGEAYIPTDEFIAHLVRHHKEVIIMMDNDEAGRTATRKLLLHHPIFTRSAFIDNGLYFDNGKEVKDPSDYIKYSQGDFNYLKTKLNI